MPGAERKDIRYTCVKAIEKPIQTRIQNLVKHLRRSVLRKYTLFRSNTCISNARLKLAKNQANAKQHPEFERFAI